MPNWAHVIIEIAFQSLGIGLLCGLISVVYHAIFIWPSEARGKVAAEQTKKAELELQRAQIEARKREEPRGKRKVEDDN